MDVDEIARRLAGKEIEGVVTDVDGDDQVAELTVYFTDGSWLEVSAETRLGIGLLDLTLYEEGDHP